MFAVAQGKLLSQFWGDPGVPSVIKDKCLCQLSRKLYNILNYSVLVF